MSNFFKCYRNAHLRFANHKMTVRLRRRLDYWSRQLAKAEKHVAKRKLKLWDDFEVPF